MRPDVHGEVETWRSAFGKTAGVVFGVAGLLGFGIYYCIFLAGPMVAVTRYGEEVSIETQFLEYNLGINRLLLEDVSESRAVLQASANGDLPMTAIRLKAGPQDLLSLIGPNGQAFGGEGKVVRNSPTSTVIAPGFVGRQHLI